jgi:hypothetical protein
VPRLLPKKGPFRPDDVVAAWQSFAWDSPSGRPFTIVKGTRLRGDHEVVLGCPFYFHRADAPADEVPNLWDHVPEPPQHEAEFHRVEPPPPDDEAVVALVELQVGLGGRRIRRGEKVRRDDPVVQAHPEHFAVVTPLRATSPNE